MDKFPKFIIEDGNLILSKVTYHHQLVTDKTKVKGGGWFRFLEGIDAFIFSGESHDFGPASFEDVKACVMNKKVFLDRFLHRNISDQHNFCYDTGYEIIQFEPEK